jgi:hypothetical protein
MGITYCIATIDPEDVEVNDLAEEDRVDFFDRRRRSCVRHCSPDHRRDVVATDIREQTADAVETGHVCRHRQAPW